MKKEYPLVSIVNVTWNGKELLKAHLPSLKNLKYPKSEVIIVDNASTDGSVEFIRNNYPEFKIIQNKENLGTAEGSNVAIEEAKGKYIFWVSNDMEFDPSIVDYLVKCCESDDSIGICTVKMRRFRNGRLTREIESVGANVDLFGIPVARGTSEADNGQHDYLTDVFFSFGGAMFIRKSLLEEIGGYDSDYFTLGDDIDLSWRAHLAGYRVVVEPKAFLYHCLSATLGSTHSRAQKRYLSERNTLRTLLKNYSRGYLIFILPLYLLILILEACFFMVIGKPSMSRVGIDTLIWNIKRFKGTLKKRREVQNLRKVKDGVIRRLMLKRSEKIRVFFDFLFNRKAEHWQGYFGNSE